MSEEIHKTITPPIIEVDGVSKRFIRRAANARDLRERFSSLLRGGKPDAGAANTQTFWALKDISFRIAPGETIGIVGHNGSGKSTMLKMLTGIMAPTQGQIRTHGRIGALIEVGAGFHPDLSGRENVFLNGSILGLTRKEIASRLDQIVDFAGLAAFIDMPVKRYSSGMYMRLGFSVAAHTDPDILLVDEVLAVGDTLFQRKCLRYLHEFVAKGGAAVFVSHSMAQVAEICTNCIWLDHGEMRFIGPTAEAIDQYMAVVTERENAELMRTHPDEWAAMEAERLAAIEAEEEEHRFAIEREESERREREAAESAEQERLTALMAARDLDPNRGRLMGVTMRDTRGIAQTRIRAGEPLRVEISYRWGPRMADPILGVDIFRDDGLHMFTTSSYDHKLSLRALPSVGTIALDIGHFNLNSGKYRLQVNLFPHSETPDWWQHPDDELSEAVWFEVLPGPFSNGCVFLPNHWDLAPLGHAPDDAPDSSMPSWKAAAVAPLGSL